MFGPNHSKLKTNLKLAIQRLKLLERKKTENARKSTKEIADYIQLNKYDRARIKVEHIIREDYLVEGMEIVEMYCDLLLARFGLVESMKELDLGLYECVTSLIWVAPRLESECGELKIISEELQNKYGKEFALMCRANKNEKVNERLLLKMSEQAPGDLLVEKYLVEIAKSHNVQFKPDPGISVRDPDFFYSSVKYDDMKRFENDTKNNNNNHNGHGNGGHGSGGSSGGGASVTPIFPSNKSAQQVSHIGFDQRQVPKQQTSPKKLEDSNGNDEKTSDIDFPSVPFDNMPNRNGANNSSDSYDDLAARFANLKKK